MLLIGYYRLYPPRKPLFSWRFLSRGDHYIEAKNCHMVYPDGHGYFPDSISARASRHVAELSELVKEGHRCRSELYRRLDDIL